MARLPRHPQEAPVRAAHQRRARRHRPRRTRRRLAGPDRAPRRDDPRPHRRARQAPRPPLPRLPPLHQGRPAPGLRRVLRRVRAEGARSDLGRDARRRSEDGPSRRLRGGVRRARRGALQLPLEAAPARDEAGGPEARLQLPAPIRGAEGEPRALRRGAVPAEPVPGDADLPRVLLLQRDAGRRAHRPRDPRHRSGVRAAARHRPDGRRLRGEELLHQRRVHRGGGAGPGARAADLARGLEAAPREGRHVGRRRRAARALPPRHVAGPLPQQGRPQHA